MSSKMVDVDLDARTVTCRPDKGNCYVDRSDNIKWKNAADKKFEFRLRFRKEPVAGLPLPPTPWPFGDTPPPAAGTPDTTPWCTHFEGTTQVEGVFEYTVEARDEDGSVFALDPMIIVRT